MRLIPVSFLEFASYFPTKGNLRTDVSYQDTLLQSAAHQIGRWDMVFTSAFLKHLMPCNAHCQHCATKIPLWQLATQICHYNIDLGLSKIQKTITSHSKGVPYWTQRRMLSSADVGLPVQMAGGKVSLSRAVHKNSTRHTL